MTGRRPSTTQRVDFLCAGMGRSATTWLASALRAHPATWLPPRKELHYFTRSPSFQSASYLSRRSSRWDGVREIARSKEVRTRLRRDLRSAIGHLRIRDLAWLGRYYIGVPDDTWYLKLFERDAAYIGGELTPSYSQLGVAEVRDVQLLCPQAKILVMLRDPIDWTWSHLKHRSRNGWLERTDLSSPESVVEHLQHSISPRHYIDVIDTWSSVYGNRSLWLGFFDDVVDDPNRLLTSLAEFLGIDAREFPDGGPPPINAASGPSMPREVERELARLYLPVVAELAERFDGPFEKWLTRAEGALTL
ncbi:MAG: sulfotransferase [Acidimicrobiales bacterium]